MMSIMSWAQQLRVSADDRQSAQVAFIISIFNGQFMEHLSSTGCARSGVVLCVAPSVPQPVVQSRRRPLLGPSPG